PPRSHPLSFPTRRSSDLAPVYHETPATSIPVSVPPVSGSGAAVACCNGDERDGSDRRHAFAQGDHHLYRAGPNLDDHRLLLDRQDRKSTRLNSSHVKISY